MWLYLIQNKINNKVYVGASINVNNRWARHKAELRKGNHHNKKLMKAWNKYGESQFDFFVIDEATCEEELYALEILYIKIFEAINNGYNIHTGGNHPPILRGDKNAKYWKNKGHLLKGWKHTDAAKHAMSIAGKLRIGSRNSMFGHVYSEDTLNKMRLAKKDRYKGKNHPQFGKHRSEETKRKIGLASKERQKTCKAERI